MTNPLFKRPLTTAQLQEIQARNQGNHDVWLLLWEVKRLRATVLRANQLQRDLSLGGGPGIILKLLRDELEGEPVITEQPSLDL